MPPTTDKASLDLARQIDQMCDQFEARWAAGERPRVEDFVAPLPAPLRGRLLAALLPVELELLSREGRPPSEADCRGRFPGLESVIGEVFAKRQERLASGETSVSRDSVPSPHPVATTPEVRSPQTLGRFVVTRVLGEGAFGTVYLAHDPRLDRDVAIKVPKVDALGDSFDTDRFLREARTAASLRHTNICPVYEADVHEGRPFIVMAYVAGQPLDKFLKAQKGPMAEKQAAVIVRRLALALQAAHEKGIVHRDLKPANVMLERERKDVVVMDFGLARGPKVKDARATQSGVIMGTPAYMSPEQARGEAKTVGPAADVYSLGVMLYEMLAGRRPFHGTVAEVLGQILHVEPEPPSKVRPGVDAKLEAICLKAMAKDAATRYASMKEFAAALDGWLRTPRGPDAETAKAAHTKQDAGGSAGTSTRQVAKVVAAMLAEQKQETAAAVGDAVRKARTPRWVFVLLALLFVGGMSVLAGIILFARTPTATVMIYLDVDLNDKTLSFFMDGKEMSAEDFARPIELYVGERELVVKRGEAVVRKYRFTVTKDGAPRIELKDQTPVPPEKLTPEDEDRKLADWLLSIGATVTVSVDSGPARKVGKGEPLPAGALQLLSYGIWINDKINDETAEPILRWIERRKIESASFFGTRVGDSTVRRLVEIPTVKRIYLGATRVTSACVPSLAKRTDLVALQLGDRPITDQDLEKLRGLVNLQELHLGATSVTDGGMKHLKELRKLRVLTLGGTSVTGTGLDELSGLPLENLTLNQTKVRGAKDLARLKNLPELKSVSLCGLLLQDDDLKPLAECKSIEELLLHDNRITDAGLDVLAQMKWLRQMFVAFGNGDNLVTVAGVERLRKALPNCNVIYEPPGKPEEGFVTIFNGKDLDGWDAPTRPEAFAVDPDGHLTARGDTPAGRMHWLTTKKEYTDYVLRLDFQFALPLPAGTNSAIAIRSAPDGPAVRPHRLYIELRNVDRVPKTGALMYTSNDAVEPKTPIGPLSAGEWHALEIEVRGPLVKVTIDGKLVNDVDLTKIDRTLLANAEKWAEAELDRKKGHIGIQSWKNPVKFRNIRVKDLSGDARTNPIASDPDRAAAETVLDLGGHVLLANGGGLFGPKGGSKIDLPQGPFKVERVEFYDKKDLPADLFAALGRLDGLRVAVFHRDRFPPEALAPLIGCKSLQEIALADCGLRDQDLAPLAGMTWLERVGVGNNTLGPATVDLLLGLKKLTFLDITQAKIGDAEVGKLVALPLTTLAINGTAVTDKGLAALHKLAGLKALGLEGCPGVTDAGVAGLIKALPNCKVKR